MLSVCMALALDAICPTLHALRAASERPRLSFAVDLRTEAITRSLFSYLQALLLRNENNCIALRSPFSLLALLDDESRSTLSRDEKHVGINALEGAPSGGRRGLPKDTAFIAAALAAGVRLTSVRRRACQRRSEDSARDAMREATCAVSEYRSDRTVAPLRARPT